MSKSYNIYYNLGYWFLLLIILVFAGFYTTYFKVFFKPANPVIHVHFALMSVWIVMLIVQPFFIKYKKLTHHRMVGKVSYLIVPLVIVSSFFMIRFAFYNAVETARQQVSGATMDKLTRIAADNSAIPFFYLGWFVVFYVLAVKNRRRSAVHARYMMATALTLLGPTVDRILFFYFNISDYLGVWLFAITFLLIDFILLLLLYKDYKEKKRLAMITIALSIYLVGQVLFYTLPGTTLWQDFVLFIMRPAPSINMID